MVSLCLIWKVHCWSFFCEWMFERTKKSPWKCTSKVLEKSLKKLCYDLWEPWFIMTSKLGCIANVQWTITFYFDDTHTVVMYIQTMWLDLDQGLYLQGQGHSTHCQNPCLGLTLISIIVGWSWMIVYTTVVYYSQEWSMTLN